MSRDDLVEPGEIAAFWRGVRAAGMRGAPEDDARLLTVPTSPWLFDRCEVCGHSFRRGDAVRTRADGRAVHDLPALPCASGAAAPATPTDPGAVLAFYEGLREAWPVAQGARAERLLPGDPLLVPPVGRVGRHACFVCSHTLRPWDAVVRCPCGRDPSGCRVAIHSDPSRQLRCWDSWVEAGQGSFCPRTMEKVDGGGSR